MFTDVRRDSGGGMEDVGLKSIVNMYAFTMSVHVLLQRYLSIYHRPGSHGGRHNLYRFSNNLEASASGLLEHFKT